MPCVSPNQARTIPAYAGGTDLEGILFEEVTAVEGTAEVDQWPDKALHLCAYPRARPSRHAIAVYTVLPFAGHWNNELLPVSNRCQGRWLWYLSRCRQLTVV